MIYLASPYSHPSPDIRHQRFLAANKAAAHLIKEGHVVFSPLSHSHPIAETGVIDPMWGGWYEQDDAFLQKCDAIYVLTIDGWKESKGVAHEIDLAIKLGLWVVFGTWGQ